LRRYVTVRDVFFPSYGWIEGGAGEGLTETFRTLKAMDQEYVTVLKFMEDLVYMIFGKGDLKRYPTRASLRLE
jgi:hypothetical protein